ncbi:MAG: DUF3108 domain-containing protein [Deltaproteobacteria bacterium]|nr:DUF3108 domain-containing protein [Deltaproteobacteria bacterium]MCW8892872.1 DUF3108 domain-containing protein [Deltaproteobacteria bacterium]
MLLLTSFIFCSLSFPGPVYAQNPTQMTHPIYALLNEQLDYDISFLWFDRLAEGSITLTEGEDPATFLIIMQARTLGLAALFTRDRLEKFQTLMQIGADGLLLPLWHSSHTVRGRGRSRSEKITKYSFDYKKAEVRYQKIKNGRPYTDQLFDMEIDKPLFDILSALYNLRLGYFGAVGEERILIPTFHRKGPQDIIIEPLIKKDRKDKKFFANDPVQTRILVDPSVFGTKGRDILASFDAAMRPQKGIIKNVIGLGDVRGILRRLHVKKK